MKKTLLLTVMTALAFQVSASSEFPEWKMNPQADLDEGLIAGVSCVESMGDITLDMDVSTMEARASLAASLEAMVQKELERSSDSNTKKIKTADRKEKVVTTSITAKSTSKQLTNQLMKYTWVSESVSVEKDIDEYLCTRVVARLPQIVTE
ncbi:conserved exported hypothetical protein [Vibrio chagasii]|uniref:hypothetical protein n=1 Tax=Vibrio chagasii TaxID=170679 RepID=UPI001EFE8159|nr:hypothetical protein [Vibrio chagasii]MCG9562304.1 hypothetical protein [Vibrio chagasii]CAH6845382.1 conserved exported hypothetical protein [Vibrio chagasii]CAH7048998.1 conserved exported hypothetical protein [Vibrio chagasii]CAH7102220.1 conserved exported hypothetical protein [Vibrio chagasii]